MPYHAFIVEDHPLMRGMLADFVAALPDLHVSGTARSAEEALTLLPGSAELVLVDIALPGISGIELIQEVRARWPHLVCLACSGHDELSYVQRALAAGARGYVAKGDPVELSDAIERVLRGHSYVSAALRERVEADAGEGRPSA